VYAQIGGVEAQNGAVVADLHDFDEEQDSDLDPHQSKQAYPDPTQSEKMDPDPLDSVSDLQHCIFPRLETLTRLKEMPCPPGIQPSELMLNSDH
jgi:hypothetical protein